MTTLNVRLLLVAICSLCLCDCALFQPHRVENMFEEVMDEWDHNPERARRLDIAPDSSFHVRILASIRLLDTSFIVDFDAPYPNSIEASYKDEEWIREFQNRFRLGPLYAILTGTEAEFRKRRNDGEWR